MQNFKSNDAMTLTFGDVAENHKGMQKIGLMSKNGFNKSDLIRAQNWFSQKNIHTIMIKLHHYLPEEYQNVPEYKSYILIIKNAVSSILDIANGNDLLYLEQTSLVKDTHAYMYGRVVNKHARHNLCFGEEDQEPEYDNGKGRVYAFNNLPYLNEIRNKLHDVVGESGSNLQAEGNYYFDTTKCGIGFHGDAERKKVIAIRLGETIPLCFNWYKNHKPIANPILIPDLSHGDIYIMSEKTTGYDWKTSSICTLRHAAGCDKYTTISEPKPKNAKNTKK